MKTLMFAALTCVVCAAFGEAPAAAPQAKAGTVPAAAQAAAPVQAKARLTAEQRKAVMEKRRQAREAMEKAAAKKAGMTLDEYRADRKAKRDAAMAKRLGMTPEDYARLSVNERRIKFTEMMCKAREAKQKKAPVAVPAAAVPVAK